MNMICDVCRREVKGLASTRTVGELVPIRLLQEFWQALNYTPTEDTWICNECLQFAKKKVLIDYRERLRISQNESLQ